MSKLYLEYLKRKKEDNHKYYLFKSGMFYIFLDEDAKEISKITLLRLINLNKDIVKCGFPENSLDKYLNIFKNLGLDVEIVNEYNVDNNISNKIIKRIVNLDINALTPVKALNVLSEFKDMLNSE